MDEWISGAFRKRNNVKSAEIIYSRKFQMGKSENGLLKLTGKKGESDTSSDSSIKVMVGIT